MNPFLLLLSTAQADDILIPHFFSKDGVDAATLSGFENQMVDELRRLGANVVDPMTLETEYPAFINNCYTSQVCVERMLNRAGAKMIVVASIDNGEVGYNVSLRYFRKSDPAPLQVLVEKDLTEDKMNDFWVSAGQEANVLFEMLPSITESQPKTDPKVVYINPDPVKPKAPPKTLDDDTRLRGLPKKLQDDYLNSPFEVSEWLKVQRIRANNVLVEIHLGVSFGDVVRRYDTRIGLNPQLQTYGIYENDSWITGGPGVNMGGSIGYAPTWWLETSIYGGVVLYQKELSTGWEVQESPGVVIEEDQVFYDPATSAVGQIEPRIRLFMAPSGPVKPYIMGAAFIRIFDGYNPPQLEAVNYSFRPGGVHVGATGGIGLAFDSYSPVGVFMEVPYTYLLNAADYSRLEISSNTPDNTITSAPAPAEFTNQIIAFKVGMSLRFQ